jgi:RES domain-containing protein
MALKEHPRSADFLRWFTKNKKQAEPLNGVFFRVAGPRHTTAAEMISGIGAKKAGGRWNPVGEMRVVYLSREPETALTEALARCRYFNLPVSDNMPKVVVPVIVQLNRVLDLSRADLTGEVPELMAECLAEDWRALNARSTESASQAVGRAAFSAKLQGLLVPSKAAPEGLNLLAFPENLSAKSRLEVQNADELDKLGKPT